MAMPTSQGMNIEPFKYEPGRGSALAKKASRVLLAAYMSAYDTSIRDVADAFGLPYDAVRCVINAQIGSDHHRLLAERLELFEEIETERQRIYDEEARPRRPDGKPICGARTRSGQPCRAPGIGNGGRCRMHGGLSTGPRTDEGRRRTGDAACSRIIERKRVHREQATDIG